MICLVPQCAAPSVADDCVCEQHAAVEARAVEQHRMVREADIAEMRGEVWPPNAKVVARPRVPIKLDKVAGGAYGQAALRGIVEELCAATNGTRNNALNRAAFNMGALVAGGQVTEMDGMRALRAAAKELELGDWEAKGTIRSGWMKGLENPRVPSAA